MKGIQTMKQRRIGRTRKSLAALGLALSIVSLPGVALAEEVTGYYIGGSAHSLGNKDNWKDGIRPGRFDDGGVTNGTYGGTMIFDDQATGGNESLQTANLASISNIVFKGEMAKAFSIHDWDMVRVEPGGRLEIEADSGKTLSFGAGTKLMITDVSSAGQYIDIVNNSKENPLLLGSFGNEQTENSQLYPEFRFSGEGDIVLHTNSWTPNGFNPLTTGGSIPVFVFNQTGTFKHEGLDDTYADALIVPASDTSRRIELNTHGFRLCRMQSRGDAIQIGADTVITGAAGLDFGYSDWDYCRVSVAEGKFLTLDVGKLTTSYTSGSWKGIWFVGNGTTILTSSVTNTSECTYIENYAAVKSPIVGAANSEISPMGRGPCVSVANGGRFVYTGSGETTDRGIQIRYASDGYLEQGGTGPLVMSGSCVIANTGSSTLYFVNDTESEGTYSGLLADNGSGKLAIRKTGSGLWRIDCAATYTGATTVNAGTLALGPSGSIASSALTLNGGTLRIENAAASFNSLTLAANTVNGLSVADGVSYTLPAFTVNSGSTLDISLGTGAELTVTGIADGKAPSWLTVGGATGMIVGGKVKSVGDFTHKIDAKGGVIPDDSAAIVGITTAVGAGTHVTLEKSTTTVGVVNQSQGQDAEISLKYGETLNVSEIVVSEDAGDLAVDSAGSATISGPDSTPVCLNPAEGTVLALSGNLNIASAEIKGSGTVQLGADVDIGSLTTSGSPALAVPLSTYVHLDSWNVSNAVAKFTGPGALSADSLTLGGEETADSGLVISGGTVTNSTGVFKNGSGYLRLEGGSFIETGTGNDAAWGFNPSQVTFEQTGGVYRHEGEFVLGRWDAQLSLYLSGGQFTINGACQFPTWGAGCNRYTVDGNRLNYVLTVDGESAFKANIVYMGRISKGHSSSANEWANPAMLNFNGGTSTVWQIVRDTNYKRSDSASSRAFVNFNGGTLKTTNTSGAFGSGSEAIDRVTVFAGGATLDTDGRNIASDMPISAPNGKGVVSVPVPAEVLSKTFAAPPTVAIIGDGEGASARVLFNPATGNVTGVQVLSPGWGYTSAKARFNHGGYTCIGESIVELDDVECGQLVKAGTGVYTFNAANSVTKLKVAGGSVKSGVNNTFPAETSLTLDGGNYDMDGHSQTFGSVSFGASGGTILNGAAAAGNLVCDFAAALAGNPGVADLSNVSFAAGAKTLITGYDPDELETLESVLLLRFASGAVPASVPPLDESVELPKGWVLRMTQAGLKLSRQNGLVLIFR